MQFDFTRLIKYTQIYKVVQIWPGQTDLFTYNQSRSYLNHLVFLSNRFLV